MHSKHICKLSISNVPQLLFSQCPCFTRKKLNLNCHFNERDMGNLHKTPLVTILTFLFFGVTKSFSGRQTTWSVKGHVCGYDEEETLKRYIFLVASGSYHID